MKSETQFEFALFTKNHVYQREIDEINMNKSIK